MAVHLRVVQTKSTGPLPVDFCLKVRVSTRAECLFVFQSLGELSVWTMDGHVISHCCLQLLVFMCSVFGFMYMHNGSKNPVVQRYKSPIFSLLFGLSPPLQEHITLKCYRFIFLV